MARVPSREGEEGGREVTSHPNKVTACPCTASTRLHKEVAVLILASTCLYMAIAVWCGEEERGHEVIGS